MHIQINAAHNIDGHEALSVWASDAVKSGLGRQSAVSYTHLDVYKRQAKSAPEPSKSTARPQ